MTGTVWVRFHGIPVPREYIIQVKKFVEEAPVGTRGWQRRAVRKALHQLKGEDNEPIT